MTFSNRRVYDNRRIGEDHRVGRKNLVFSSNFFLNKKAAFGLCIRRRDETMTRKPKLSEDFGGTWIGKSFHIACVVMSKAHREVYPLTIVPLNHWFVDLTNSCRGLTAAQASLSSEDTLDGSVTVRGDSVLAAFFIFCFSVVM